MGTSGCPHPERLQAARNLELARGTLGADRCLRFPVAARHRFGTIGGTPKCNEWLLQRLGEYFLRGVLPWLLEEKLERADINMRCEGARDSSLIVGRRDSVISVVYG